MFCIFCKNADTEVIETRISDDGATVRRRRVCLKCEKRLTTYERVDRDKLRRGLVIPCEKTTISAEQVESVINEVEQDLKQRETTEIESKEIGNLVAKKLKKLDKIAYIRFASVFRRFVDLEDFEKELKKLS